MELIRGTYNLRAKHQGCVLTIGNFDGVHRGHQALLRRLKQQGQRLGLPVTVIIFEPQPAELFAGDRAPARLTRLRDKCHYLAQCDVDFLLCIKFNSRFASCSAQAFVADLLVKKLGVKHLIIGDDFRFGADRQGDYAFLQTAGQSSGFTVVNSDSFCEAGERISSTAIRQALQNDDLILAKTYLGRAFSLSGRVVHGDEIGRTLGFPTANVLLKRTVLPVKGVYAVDVYGVTITPLSGVANIGTRPTVAGIRQQLEVHILDTQINLYGRHIDVVLRTKLRNERRFASLDELKQQIAKDVLAARNYFELSPQA